MCGGYYEEELVLLRNTGAATEGGKMIEEKYYGPSTQFHSTPTFGRAAAICELNNIACRLDPYDNTIHFKNVDEEVKFSIAWRKAIAGS